LRKKNIYNNINSLFFSGASVSVYNLILVDDEEFILEQLNAVFDWRGLGYNVVGCFSEAAAALAYIKNNDVDALLTDIRLGRDTGHELALSARAAKPEIEIILISAFSEFEYARSAIRLNIHDYLVKPVTYAAVADCFGALKKKLDERKIERVPEKTKMTENYQIALARRYIEEHIADDVSLEDVAAHVFMNRIYFSRFFKKHTGMHFIAYITELRIEKAIALLKDPHNKASEISLGVGYHSKQHFYKLFKQHTGRTPVEYRNEVLSIADRGEKQGQSAI